MPKMQPQGGVAPRVQPKQWNAMTPQMQGQIQARPNPVQGMQRPPVKGRPMQPIQMGQGYPQVQPKTWQPMQAGMQGQIQAQPRQLTPEEAAQLEARFGRPRGMLAQPPKRY